VRVIAGRERARLGAAEWSACVALRGSREGSLDGWCAESLGALLASLATIHESSRSESVAETTADERIRQ